MHLLRKTSASNSDSLGRYQISKLRRTFTIVILIQQAEASNIPPVRQSKQTSITSSDYKAYKELVAQTKVKPFPNRAGTGRPHATWKWEHMRRKMTEPGESIAEEIEPEDTDGTDSVPGAASIGDTESTDTASPASTRKAFEDVPSSSGILSPAGIRSRGKAVKEKNRDPFYKGFKGHVVVYLPGDINGLAKKLHLLAAEFIGSHVLDALLRLKQLTSKEYTDITARLAASL